MGQGCANAAQIRNGATTATTTANINVTGKPSAESPPVGSGSDARRGGGGGGGRF